MSGVLLFVVLSFAAADLPDPAICQVFPGANNEFAWGSGVAVAWLDVPCPTNPKLTKVAILTAEHVVEDNKTVLVHWEDGVKSMFRVIEKNKDADVALLYGWADAKFVHVRRIATAAPAKGRAMRVAGYGLTQTLPVHQHTWYGTIAGPVDDETTLADCEAAPGDSGGPVYNIDGEVIGIVSGGMGWFAKEGARTVTWPVRAAGVGPCNDLLDLVPGRKDGEDHRASTEDDPGVSDDVMSGESRNTVPHTR